MATSTEMLAAVQAAYTAALSGRVVEFNGNRFEPHDIDKLRGELSHWETRVKQEQQTAAGLNSSARYAQASFSD